MLLKNTKTILLYIFSDGDSYAVRAGDRIHKLFIRAQTYTTYHKSRPTQTFENKNCFMSKALKMFYNFV